MRVLAIGTMWLLATALAGCDSSTADAADNALGSDQLAPPTDSGAGGTWTRPDADNDAAVSNPLCGIGRCDPGNPNSCPFIGPDGASNDGPDEDAADGDADAAMSESGASDADAPDADVPDADATARDAQHDGEAGPEDATLLDVASPQPTFACYIRTSDTGAIRACEQPGSVGDEETCSDSSDCGVGFACVKANVRDTLSGQANRCRKLLCALPRTCNDEGKFYEELPLYERGRALASVLVPVCSPVDHCQLLTQSCPLGKACMLVGDNQTTCMTPGVAGVDAPCGDEVRCAAGLVCSKTSNRCKRLCLIASNECNGGTCQGGNKALPDSIGVCTGEIVDGG